MPFNRKVIGLEIGKAPGVVNFVIRFEPEAGKDDQMILGIPPAQAAMLAGMMLANAGAILGAISALEERGFAVVPAGALPGT